jgi:hypothetical protein
LYVVVFFTMTYVDSPALGWWAGGHSLLTKAAVTNAPGDMPAFFREGADELALMSHEPDNWKDPAAPHLRSTERPEHFIDLEYLDGAELPQTRVELQRLLVGKKLDPDKSGYLPYAIVEGYERLLLAFRDHRLQPDSAAVQHRVLVYAGWLAHYAQDASMPLHTTRNYDGKPWPDNQLQQKGIHARLDAYPGKNLTAEVVAEGLKPDDVADVWKVITTTIQDSSKLVDQAYELDTQGAFENAPEKGRDFVLQRARAGARLTLNLWYAAWRNSEKLAAAGKRRE